MHRPEYWDIKYSNLDYKTRMRESERDGMIYDLVYGKPNYYVGKPELKDIKYFINHVETELSSDAYKYKLDINQPTPQIKHIYASLCHNKYNKQEKINNLDNLDVLAGYVLLIAIFLIIVSLTTSDFIPVSLIVSITLGIILVLEVPKLILCAKIQNDIDKIEYQQLNILKELKK